MQTPEFAVRVVSCAGDGPGWSAPRRIEVREVVLVRRGMFRVRSDGIGQTVDPTLGYLLIPGRDHRVAHHAGGDVCTVIAVGEGLWREVAGETSIASHVPVDGRLELAHRLLLRSTDDPGERAEHLVRALGLVARVPAGPGRRDLALLAREAVLADHPDAGDLIRLARALGVSPAHLSRTFRAHCDMTLSRYRNRVRVSRVLARIEEGEDDLAGLAVELGFADQAHLTRAVRREVGHPPGRLRELFSRLGPGPPGSDRSGPDRLGPGSLRPDRPRPAA